jgi:hypothetical protein
VGEADVFKFDSGLAENQARQLGTTSARVVEVVKLVNRHTNKLLLKIEFKRDVIASNNFGKWHEEISVNMLKVIILLSV